jgi:hypothetical protein
MGQYNSTTTNAIIEKEILTEILIQLRPYLLNSFLTEQDFENYISFAVDIYESIYHLDVDISNKLKMIELMVKSIDLPKDKKNRNTGTDI